MSIAPGGKAAALQNSSLRFSQAFGAPVNVKGMLGFVTQVEYADGTVWIPSRTSLAEANLLSVMAPSPEEQRLSEMYRRKGLNAVVEELNKFQTR
jgi:hypothetical protein